MALKNGRFFPKLFINKCAKRHFMAWMKGKSCASSFRPGGRDNGLMPPA